jgi:hypothetical protein
MADQGGGGGKYNISFGNVSSSQFVTGDYNHVAQTVGMTPEDVAALRGVFDGLRTVVSADAPAERREEAVAQVAELEQALVAKEPDPSRVRRALQWFRDHAPQLVGAVTSVVVNPLVGRAVAGAGEAVAKRVRDAVEDA